MNNLGSSHFLFLIYFLYVISYYGCLYRCTLRMPLVDTTAMSAIFLLCKKLIKIFLKQKTYIVCQYKSNMLLSNKYTRDSFSLLVVKNIRISFSDLRTLGLAYSYIYIYIFTF